jgi:hypothetical protein
MPPSSCFMRRRQPKRIKSDPYFVICSRHSWKWSRGKLPLSGGLEKNELLADDPPMAAAMIDQTPLTRPKLSQTSRIQLRCRSPTAQRMAPLGDLLIQARAKQPVVRASILAEDLLFIAWGVFHKENFLRRYAQKSTPRFKKIRLSARVSCYRP